MTFWPLLALILGAVQLAGLCAMIRCAQRAPRGYQGADGFHTEAEQGLRPMVAGDPAEREWEPAA